jgi:predicted SprT family Zn-dependent metalloprotease
MTTPIQRVQDKCKAVSEIALRLYGVDLNKVSVQFNLKGRVGGWASAKGFPRVYSVRFNHDMVMRETDEMVDVVVPHELAHIVCYMKPELGRNHDAGWKRVCTALGGSGDRTHDMAVVYGKGTTYEYTTDRGNKVRMNDRLHSRVQAGMPLRYRKGLGTVSLGCAYSIVGVQGRTLQSPVVRQPVLAPNHPDALVTFQRTPPVVITQRVFGPAVVASPKPPVAPTFAAGHSKASISRALMLSGYQRKMSYEEIIQAMMLACGYDRQLARGTFKANAPKVGIPASFIA